MGVMRQYSTVLQGTMMTEQADYERISIQIPPHVKIALDAEAHKQGRSRSFEAVQRLAKSLGIKLHPGKPSKKK
jgi:hypothetical protein